ncbi:MAG: hypothetical protein H6797_00375 [Candidatus Nomurabacteria bacterium]|nr:MAG: hypothetical protein H6797_00375 [Candidatus Nomurabacteria bacterium]
MDTRGTSDTDNSSGSAGNESSGAKKKGVKGLARALGRYWYALVVLVVIVAGAIAWFVQQASADAAWQKATDDYGRADYAAAAKLLDNVAVPTDEKRLTVYAQTMLATRQLDKALPAYNSLYAKKKDPAVKIVIGNIYNEQKKYDEAAKTYRDIINANTTYIQAYVNLSTLYKLQSKTQDAIDVAKQGVKANPNSATLYELLISMLLDNQGSTDYKQAVATLKKLNPSDPLLQTLKK